MLKYYFTYILECADKSYYTGITNDIDRRIAEHNEGENPIAYTYSRRPVKLVYLEQFFDPSTAIELEKQIKGWSRKKKDALIANNWDKLKELSVCKNETSYMNYKKNKKCPPERSRRRIENCVVDNVHVWSSTTLRLTLIT